MFVPHFPCRLAGTECSREHLTRRLTGTGDPSHPLPSRLGGTGPSSAAFPSRIASAGNAGHRLPSRLSGLVATTRTEASDYRRRESARESGPRIGVRTSTEHDSPWGKWRDLAPGDTLYLHDDVLLQFTVRRPLQPLVHFPPWAMGAFGEPDALGIVGESEVVWRWREEIAAAAYSAQHVLVPLWCLARRLLDEAYRASTSERSPGPVRR